jgi:hypothetical protein
LIIKEVAINHCVYLEEVRPELTEEDLSFMTYVKEVGAAYQKWVEKTKAEGKVEGKIEGKIELVSKMVRAKFGIEMLTPQVIDRLEGLNEQQLDEFTARIFEWQDSIEMLDWLEHPFV